jgi:uncharacterized Fe-S cluster-containing radical SAM superfamily protein
MVIDNLQLLHLKIVVNINNRFKKCRLLKKNENIKIRVCLNGYTPQSESIFHYTWKMLLFLTVYFLF